MDTSTKSNLQTGGESSDFLKAIQEKLLGQSGVISSTNSTLETRINDAISGVKTAAEKTNLATESAYGRELGYQQQQAGEAITAGRAAGSGGILNMAALRSLTETTDKSLKDLEQRKQELILQNDAAAASKISDLQLKALEFQQQAQQQTFSNLLGMANLGVQLETEARLAKTQTFTETQAVNSVALEYGLNPTGKTLDQITKEAMFFASDDRKAKLAQQAADLAYTKAQTVKAMQGEPISKYNDSTLQGLASTAYMLQQDPTYNIQGSQAYTQYQNLVGTATKGGDAALNKFYKFIGEEAVNKTKESVQQKETEKNPIEKDISGMGKFFDDSMKREQLKRKGYSQSEIANSSVGNIMEKGISIFESLFR